MNSCSLTVFFASPLIILSSLFAADGKATKVWKEYAKFGPVEKNLPDFHTAGCLASKHGGVTGKEYNVLEYSANPKDMEDDRDAIQRAIDAAGAAGGGVVVLPEGRYYIRSGNASDVLQIHHSNIILRGAGIDERGRQETILYLQRKSASLAKGLLGRDEEDFRENACIQIKGTKYTQTLATFTKDAKRGDTTIHVDSTAALAEGQVICLEIEDSVNLKKPKLEDNDMIVELTEPRRLTKLEKDTYANKYTKTIYSVFRVKRILSPKKIELSRPLRFNHKLRNKPRIKEFAGAVSGVGIENIGIETDWPGQFVHHKPYPYWAGKKKGIRSADEQDYLWVGIWASWAVDCWVKNVSIRDTTQAIIMVNAHHFTVQDVGLWGGEGHAGFTMAMSGENLFRNIDFVQRSCHPISLRSWCAGNVFTHCMAHFSKRDQLTAGGPHLDFHGMFPYENLFDCLIGFYPVSGGTKYVHPHSGVRNVFWNITTPPQLDRYPEIEGNEFLVGSFIDYKQQYKEYPQSFVIGCHSQTDHPIDLTIGGSNADRATPEVTVELLNQRLTVNPSLYAAQVALHKEREGTNKQDPQ